ncbi:MAG TPA: protein kinase [Vicinamibacterales bacterium]|jgi:serine/threonine protein kinase/Tol biopolymer transport system component|nr:protein kinase [Vicinamibacterales bacterium]
MIGTRLGHYDISGRLGAGGMGEVFLATDSTLGRTVAIKVLPEAFARDPERIARLEREARILASLNHPNIAAIHGFERSDRGSFVVMELVEGETLAERILRGPVPLAEALPIARQICEALESAHEKGVVHRDLKPANIKILSDNRVKVLDFGLAKAVDSQVSSPDVANSPTLTIAATGAGLILGTAAYMSPEQARGRQVDRRADIFAFGCVLFEMLSGKPAFQGEDAAEILAHVLSHEPAWNTLPVDLPPRVRELLRLCLQKDARKRRRDAGDLVIDIDQIGLEPPAPVAPAAAPRSAWWGWIAAAVCAAIAIGVSWFAWLRTEPVPQEMRLSVMTPTKGIAEFALSSDGMSVVISGTGVHTLWLQRLDRTDAQTIPLDTEARFPFWSPDGRSFNYWSGNKLWRISSTGGPPVMLAETPSAFSGSTVNQQGTMLFSTSLASPLFRASGPREPPVAITRLESTRAYGHMQPRFLPDGRHFLFFATGSPDVQGVYLGSLDGTDPKRLTAADAHGEYLEPGYVAYVGQGALVARKLDLDRGELVGDDQVLAESVAYTSATGRGAFSVSANGRIVYRASAGDRRQLIWYDRTTNRSTPIGDPESHGQEAAELSPDGRRVALDRTVQGNRDIWLLDLSRASVPRFTFDSAQDGMPVWSPDSKQIVYESKRKGPYDLYVKAVDGAAVERPLLESAYDKWPMDWSRDGAYILYYETDPKTSGDLKALPMTRRDEKTESIPVATTPFDENFGQFSPDGKWVAYQTTESGRSEIVVQSFPDPSTRRQVSSDGGSAPRWRRDGKELYFVSSDSRLMAVTLEISPGSVEPAAPVALLQTRLAGVPKHQYSVATDGRFLINEVVDDSASSLLTLILNWRPK